MVPVSSITDANSKTVSLGVSSQEEVDDPLELEEVTMSIMSESVQLNIHDELVEVFCSSVVDNAGGVHSRNGSLWLERANLGWLRDAIEKAIADEFAETSNLSWGGDNLRVLPGGHEAELYVNIFNKRAEGLECPGTFWIATSRKCAPMLLEQIRL